jgi:hypothetical protein
VEQNPYHGSLAKECILLKEFKIPLSYIMVNLNRKLYGTKCRAIIFLKKKQNTNITLHS